MNYSFIWFYELQDNIEHPTLSLAHSGLFANHFSLSGCSVWIPTVTQCGEALSMSGHYLSDMLKTETGNTAKEHIHIKLIAKAKSKLLNSDISVKSLAYDLGFESPQYFSKLFKTKTNMSPSEFRNLN